MNTRPVIESSSTPVALSASFNQDASCFAVGLDTGFCIFNSEPCQLRVSRDFNAGIGAVSMLGKANFIALIGGGKLPKFPQNKVIIWDDAKQKVAIQLPVLTTVRGVKFSRSHIVVALQNSVRVYKFQSPPEVWAVFETADNPLGLCCLGPKTLAFPGRTPGQVQLVELSTGNVSIIPAHSSPLRALDISRDGEILATASDTGTLIRVFATSNCARIAELRRGVDHAVIFSVVISPSGELLAVTSDKSTLHIFDIPHPSKSTRSEATNATRRLTSQGGGGSPGLSDVEASQKWGVLGRIPLLPRVFSDIYSFASAHFEIGDEPVSGGSTPLNSPGDSGFRPPKGIIGWTSDHSVVVIGAGRDGRWERFIIAEGDDGKRYCVRDGWKRYLGIS
ncbi:SVP1-like protein 2 [Venustampulla echinocandica]|uniref:SVP1-like protein 2 n=1 Tax=Venustampulla echinocandica TaxID=2656787 RepID=A0A370TZ58_9HELO|nr:SVP1-like protein 2 [Venustampulla echinocandica]RDL40821.1 SVP1-like protein 2 [Venustampulla echinocandica]